ncbi:MAG: TraG family conjugative transposon ATPase [Ignavibacteria bacterium]|nr:TraG family conjugative transposon ATPase [Ignavibacteria bacterium]
MILSEKDINPIYDIDNNMVLGNNGDISFLFALGLPEKYSLGEKDFDQIHLDRFRFYSMLPSNSVVHNQHIYLSRKFEGLKQNSTFLQKATNKYFTGREYNLHLPLTYITLTNFKSLKRNYLNAGLFNSGVIKHDLNRIEKFSRTVERATTYMNNSGYISYEPLEESFINNLILNYLTGFNGQRLTDIEFRPVFKIGDNYFKQYAVINTDNLPNKFVNIIEDRNYSSPDHPFYKSFFELIGLEFDCNHIVNQYVYLDDHKEHLKELEDRADKLEQFSKFGRENKTGAKEIEEYIDQIYKDSSTHLMRSHINVLVWSDNLNELKFIDNNLVSALKQLDITPYYPTKNDHIYYFISSIPTNAGRLPRQETFNIDLKKSICFDITETNYHSDEQGIVLNDRLTNLPIIKDDWDEPYKTKQITSRNALLICETGGGKTYLLLSLSRQYIENGDKIVLIDLGGAFEILSLLYPDKVAYIRYKEGEPLGLNPFHIDSAEELTSSKIASLADFVSVLWLQGEELSKHQRVSLHKLIVDYYENFSGPYNFPTFYNYVKKTPNILEKLEIPNEPDFFDFKSFIHVCSEFTTGIFKYFFNENNKASNVHEKQVVVFQLDSIKKNSSLLPIAFMAIRDVIDNNLFTTTNSRVRVFWEEAAEHLKDESMLRTIEFYFQTIRKWEGQMLLVLQTIDNIPDNKSGKAIINNFHILYILHKKNNIYDSEISRLNLSEHIKYQLLSLRSNFTTPTKRYTEFLFKLGTKANVMRLETPPEADFVFVSEKDDKVPVLAEYERTGDIEVAINNLVKQKGL